MALKDSVTGIQHLGLPTKDIKATIEFWQSLGFEVAYSTTNEGDQVAFLQMGGVCVETYESNTATGAPGAWEHLALDVDDIEAVYKEINQAGRYKICEEGGIQFLPFWANGVRYFTVMGPNGEKVEFSQML